jgi:hypothetical protein
VLSQLLPLFRCTKGAADGTEMDGNDGEECETAIEEESAAKRVCGRLTEVGRGEMEESCSGVMIWVLCLTRQPRLAPEASRVL